MKCMFCKQEKPLYRCRLLGDVYVTHIFRACLSCILKMGLIIISREEDDGKEWVEAHSS